MSLRSPSRERSISRGRSYTRSPVPSRDRSYSRSPSPRRPSLRRSKPAPSRSRSPRRSSDNGTRYRNRSSSRSPSPAPQTSGKILIQRLTKNVLASHIHEIFSEYGEITDVDMPMNRQFMTNRGLAYVLYRQSDAADAAIAHMHDGQLDGLRISVSLVSPRRRFQRSPPPSFRGGPARRRSPPRHRGARDRSWSRSPPRRRGSPMRRRERSWARSRSPARRR